MKANEAVRVVREELPGFQPGRLKTALETVLADSAKATEMVAQLTGREIDLRAERDAALGDRGKVMELTEAVRIVREIVRPLALARERWSGHGWVRDTRPADALDAVLAALEQAQGEAEEAKLMASIEHSGCEKALAQMDEAVAVMAKALAERDALRAEVERLRADLAAWPGKWNATLDREARWIEKLMQAEAERDELRSEVGRLQSKLFAAEAERDALRVRSHAAILALNGEMERLRATPLGRADQQIRQLGADSLDLLRKLERAEAALKAEKVNCPWMPRALKAEATLREIEQATEGIPEANCALANRIARVALPDPAPLPTSQPARAIEVCKRAATAPAAQPLDARAHAGDGESAQRELATAPAEGFFARGDDGHYHPDPAPAELRCVRCGSPYVAAGACSRRAEGCQGGRGEWTVYAAPACPHGHPAGSARDCACHEPEKPSGRAFRAHCLCPAGLHMPACACECHAEGKP